MRKILCAALAFALALFVLTPVLAENMDESGETLEQAAAQAEKDEIVSKAIDALTSYWKNDVYQTSGNGYLAIKYTRIVYIADVAAQSMPSKAHELFDDIHCVVEFMLLSDYYVTAPFYERAGVYECVVFHKDGTFEVQQVSPLHTYRANYFETDFSGIVARVSDRNADFNGEYALLDNEEA